VLEDLRETEELRRLCYVAVTRARDRLYLAGEIDEKGRLRRRTRSLAALLPPGLQTAFAEAAVSSADTVTWTSESGTFDFAICRAHAPLRPDSGEERRLETDTPGTMAGAPTLLVDPSRRRVTATGSATAESSAVAGASRSDRLIGTLVHRLFQRDAELSLSDDELAALGLGLVRREEAVDETDPVQTVRVAVQAYRRLRARVDVAEWLASGECHYEVPFSCVDAARPGEIVRGTLDCVVVGPDGVPTVLEFKTGAPRPEHRAQAAIYEQAARAAFCVENVRVRLVYLTSGPEM
jgi:ATP-dependent exoDNAse (exonuclease V) beta subunit